jgi:hypothetical protein
VLPLQAASPSIENRQEASNDSEMFPDSGVIVSEPEFTDIGGEYLDWNGPDVDFTDLLDPQANDETDPYSRSDPKATNWSLFYDHNNFLTITLINLY